MRRTLSFLLAALLLAAVPAGAVTVNTATIANGQTVSTSIPTGKSEVRLMVLSIPATFTGATVTFHCSETSGGTYVEVVDGDGTAISVTASDGKWVSLSSVAGSLAPCAFIKVVSASAEGGARTLKLMFK